MSYILISDSTTDLGYEFMKNNNVPFLSLSYTIGAVSYTHLDVYKRQAALSIQDGNPCYTMAIFHNGEYKENDIDVEVQKSVIGSYPNTGRVQFKTMPAVEIASATYKGSYDLIGQVNEAVARWIKDNGYDFNGLALSLIHI